MTDKMNLTDDCGTSLRPVNNRQNFTIKRHIGTVTTDLTLLPVCTLISGDDRKCELRGCGSEPRPRARSAEGRRPRSRHRQRHRRAQDQVGTSWILIQVIFLVQGWESSSNDYQSPVHRSSYMGGPGTPYKSSVRVLTMLES